MHDVVIAGAGPAGTIAALVLARAGARVMLLDRATFPRDKLCGDTLNPGALAILQRLGLERAADGALPLDGMIVTGERGVRVEGRYAPGLQGRAIARRGFDAALVSAAAAAGASIEEGVLVETARVSGGMVTGVTVRRGGHTVHIPARIAIAADGRYSRLARAL